MVYILSPDRDRPHVAIRQDGLASSPSLRLCPFPRGARERHVIKLEVLNTAAKGKKFPFRNGLTVGSGAACTIRAQHRDMCDVHARFFVSDQGRPMVETGSAQARIAVNGKDVSRAELRHHDELVVGPLKLKVQDASQMSSASLRLDQLMDNFQQHLAEEVYDFATEDLFYLSTKDPTLREAICFSIPSRDRFIDQAQVFLSRLVRQSGMGEEQVEGFMTCAKELILNAHRHGHNYDEARKILIRYKDLGQRVALTIEDEGGGFDHQAVLAAVKTKDAARAARERYQAGGFGGLGFQLITKLAPDLSYNGTGNKVTFSMAKQPG
jgi:anti-sigma regulatory factor (Ser/Thr protein kinase)